MVGPFDGFSTPDWDYIREIATKKAMAIRSQGFIHPATLVPSELEYAEGYRTRMDILETKMKPMKDDKSNTDRKEITKIQISDLLYFHYYEIVKSKKDVIFVRYEHLTKNL